MGREALLLAALAGLAAPAAGQDDEVPELGLLEYLGSWQESDEEWLVVAGIGGELDDEAENAAGGTAGETAGDEPDDTAGEAGAKAREDERDED